jgi:hypothetical protein
MAIGRVDRYAVCDLAKVTKPLQVLYSSSLKLEGRAILLKVLPTTMAHHISVSSYSSINLVSN